MPANHRYLPLLSLKAIEFTFLVAFTHIIDLDLITFASSEEPVPVDGVPSDLVHSIVMCWNGVDAF